MVVCSVFYERIIGELFLHLFLNEYFFWVIRDNFLQRWRTIGVSEKSSNLYVSTVIPSIFFIDVNFLWFYLFPYIDLWDFIDNY